jgi:hypothetical protein
VAVAGVSVCPVRTDTDADDLADEQDRRRRVRRSRRARPAMIVSPPPVTGRTGRGRDQRPAARSLTLDTTTTGLCEMPTATQIALTQITMNDARCQALFCSWLQPSDAPTTDTVATAISRVVQQLGIRGCVARIAQEFGDHPDTAARRMRWARQLIAQGPAALRREAGHDEPCSARHN